MFKLFKSFGNMTPNIETSLHLLGRYPLITEIIVNAVKYWFRMKNAKQDTLLYDCYQDKCRTCQNRKYMLAQYY